eukprot:s107_g54.t1
MDEIYTGLMRLRGPVAKTEIVGFCCLDAFGAVVKTRMGNSKAQKWTSLQIKINRSYQTMIELLESFGGLCYEVLRSAAGCRRQTRKLSCPSQRRDGLSMAPAHAWYFLDSSPGTSSLDHWGLSQRITCIDGSVYLLQSLLDHVETFLAHLACSNQIAPHLRKCTVAKVAMVGGTTKAGARATPSAMASALGTAARA